MTMAPAVFQMMLVVLLFSATESRGGPKGEYSNEWIIKTDVERAAVEALAEENGFQVLDEVSGSYILRSSNSRSQSQKQESLRAVLQKSFNVEYIEQLRYLTRLPRSRLIQHSSPVINDSFWSDMWHLKEDKFPSMGVYNTWTNGYSGNGIHVGILDDGVEPDHPDLFQNYDETASYDFLFDQTFVNHTEDDFHGTWCAGIVSAVMNDFCVVGVAYRSTFGAVKIFDSYYGLNDYGESLALTFELSRTDIYSNSWGPIDDGEIFEGPLPLAKAAFERAVTEGRNGLGAIYTWAAGNGGIDDDCNCDGYANSIYTIAVTSIGRDQAISWYSEECTNIMAGTYSGDSPDLRIATTDIGASCTTRFQGTSASCPMAAGIIALALEANPNLTWRDVKHLIVETSTRDGLINADWRTNGAGFRVSHAFGFGILNAEAMTEAAVAWTPVAEQYKCESEQMQVNSISSSGIDIVSSHASDGCAGTVQFLEHVEVWMSFRATRRGSLRITLISPSGTRNRLLRPRRFDTYNATTEWTFMTVHCWGERPSGTWTLHLETSNSATEFALNSWQLILHGTKIAPANNPAAQVSSEIVSDDEFPVGAVVGGIVGGVVLFAVVAAAVYLFMSKKPKDPTVYPIPANGHFQANS